jgi:hypothetical protein
MAMVGSERIWPPPAEGWPTVPFLHCARNMVIRDVAIKDQQLNRGNEKKQTRDNIIQVTQKGWTFGRRSRAQPECSNAIQDRGAIQQLCLRKMTKGNGVKRMKKDTGVTFRKGEDIV